MNKIIVAVSALDDKASIMQDQKTISLRERKYAQTKLALLNKALDKLKEKSFEDISVKELCETIPISEVTFFNYFPRKSDLIVYFIQLWMIEVYSWVANRVGTGGGLAAIEEIFDYTASKLPENPHIMTTIIAFYATRRGEIPFKEITAAERHLAFPGNDAAAQAPAQGFDKLFIPFLEKAVEAGELPRDRDLRLVLATIVAVFLGVPTFMTARDPSLIRPVYREQLKILWKGLR